MRQCFVTAILAAIWGIFSLFFTAADLSAQTTEDRFWIQVEAHSTRFEATERAEVLRNTLPGLSGFRLSSGWHALALGPYGRAEARALLRNLRFEGLVPRDAYVARNAAYTSRFWPRVAAFERPAPSDTGTITALNAGEPQLPPETPRQARQAERALDPDARRGLQRMLQWAGFYEAAIDGAFGPGTRAAMAAWQASNGYAVTGVLSTAQRADLTRQYNAVLDGLGMQTHVDAQAGIEISLPSRLVAFSHYEAPFVHFTGRDDRTAKVLLISQTGNRTRLEALYNILQTLTVVPPEGPRVLRRNAFNIRGDGDAFTSETRVSLADGHIKGFMLIWPTGDEARRARVASEMEASFKRRDGVLGPDAGRSNDTELDLLSGLPLRAPRLSRSGFFVDDKGTVVTTTEAVESCGTITIEGTHEVEIVTQSAPDGVAVLRPKIDLSPPAIARLASTAPQRETPVTAAGYSYAGLLNAPSLTFGTLKDVRGLNGEPDVARLAIPALPGDAGGPVLDASGTVVGMLAPKINMGRALPETVGFALQADTLRKALASTKPRMPASDVASLRPSKLSPDALHHIAKGITVLVSCWD